MARVGWYAVADLAQTDNSEDEMIVSRILFLTTYDTNMDFDALIRKHSLGDHINYV